jgi:hypothetical protein
MRNCLSGMLSCCVAVFGVCWHSTGAAAGDLVVDLGQSEQAGGVTLVGAIYRWDADGNPRTPVNPKAAIEAPDVTAKAESQDGNRWVFKNLPAARYDVVLLARDRIRVEGFHYPPLAEFDRILRPDAQAPEEAQAWIVKDIAKSKHYENKVAPLFLAGTDKQVRILVQLVRDQPTSYDGDFGTQAATVRHEVWQYTNRYGTWSKERKTKILDRILLANSEFQRWTWVWEPALGGIEVNKETVRVSYTLPAKFDPQTMRGWLPGG